MNIAMAGNLPAVQHISQGAQTHWEQLRLQISPFNSVITIDGHVFASLSDADKHWISSQYRAIVGVNVRYVQDPQVFRIFLARTDIFPPGSLLPIAVGGIAILLNPLLLRDNNRRGASEDESKEKGNAAKQIKIPRPPNAFILYRKACHEAVKAAHPGIHNNQISIILGTQWQQEDVGVRAQYKAQAAQLKKEHMLKHPNYQYQPRKASELKRRMTKKKAAAGLAQNERLSQEILDAGGMPSDHGFSGVAGNWNALDLSSMTSGYSATTPLGQVQLHSNQQRLSQNLEESCSEVLISENNVAQPWSYVDGRQGGVRTEMDAFDEFVNSHVWA